MRKVISLLTALATLGLAVSAAQASDVAFVSTVNGIYLDPTGYYVVRFNDDSAACTNLNVPKRYLLSPSTTGMTADALKSMYTAFLFAWSQDKRVQITYDDSTNFCRILRMWIL